MENKEIYTDKLIKGNRTYFFDIKQAENKSYYLKISENKQAGDDWERFHIMIFEEDFEDFEKSFLNFISKAKELKNNENISTEKAYSMEEIRKTHKSAYLPWTKNDDEKLERLYCEGKNIKQLSAIFGRNEGAIRSRIRKLELKDKYDV
ncbi:MAG: DUF3276 family protein [Moheibacter sp.]